MNAMALTEASLKFGGGNVNHTSEKIISVDDVMTTLQELQDGVQAREAYVGNVLPGFHGHSYTDVQGFPFDFPVKQEGLYPVPSYASYCSSPYHPNENPMCINHPNMHQTTDQHFITKMLQSIEPFVNLGSDSSFVSLLENKHPMEINEINGAISSPVYGESEVNSSTGNQKTAERNLTSRISIVPHVSLPATSDHNLHPHESIDQGGHVSASHYVNANTITSPEVTWQTSPKSFLDLDDQPPTSDGFYPFLPRAPDSSSDRGNPLFNSPQTAYKESPMSHSNIRPGMNPTNGEYVNKTQTGPVVKEDKNFNLNMNYFELDKEASSPWYQPLSPQSPIPSGVVSRDAGPFAWTPSTVVIRNLNFGCGGTTTALMPADEVSTSKGCVSNHSYSSTDWDGMYRSGRQFWDGLEGCVDCDFRGHDSVPPPMGLEIGQFVGNTGSLSPDVKDATKMGFNETGSDGSAFSEDVVDDEDEKFLMEMLPKKASRSCKKTKRGCRLWEFIRDLLLDSSTNPSIIRWENREVGTFRLVKSKAIARIWGMKKGNEAMNYEKLSRAMRYYYKRQVFQPVIGKRLVYSFGPRATGWRD